jgi:hypothetical protein
MAEKRAICDLGKQRIACASFVVPQPWHQAGRDGQHKGIIDLLSAWGILMRHSAVRRNAMEF